MIELLFNESAAGAMKYIKTSGTGACISSIGVKIIVDENGDQTSESYIPEPYKGAVIEGSPLDIIPLWLMADIGDISRFPDTRIQLWSEIAQNHAFESEWADQMAEQTTTTIARLKQIIQAAEPIRIWWSDSPEEVCGFYWAMSFLKDSTALITSVKIPSFYATENGYVSFRGTGDVNTEYFPELLCFERSIEQAERKILASEWAILVSENAPLRALVNGRLCSVPDDFYDFVLHRNIPDNECKVASIIGNSFGRGVSGVSDWWYAKRLRQMIASGELEVVNESKRFYDSTVRWLSR